MKLRILILFTISFVFSFSFNQSVLAQGCNPLVSASHPGFGGSTPQRATDGNTQTGFRSSYDNWQQIQFDFQCIRAFQGLRRHMSRVGRGGVNRGAQGEGVSYSIDGQTWRRLETVSSSGWNIYRLYNWRHAWYELPYGWSAWIVPSSPVYARYVRFNWDGENDLVNELEFKFSPSVLPPPSTKTVNYVESDEDFPNPERGFYRWSSAEMGNFDKLDPNELRGYRTPYRPGDNPGPALYDVHNTLVYRAVVLKDDATPSEIENLQRDLAADFGAARQAGVKYILRFAYTYGGIDGCEPTEPVKDTIIEHIRSLYSPLPPSTTPFFNEYKDVIALFQFGFIGEFGEGYFTSSDEFGCERNGLTAQNWQNRIDVLRTFLSKIPIDRMAQVRIPQLKQKYLFTPSAGTGTSSQLTASNAYGTSSAARIGFYNDCFLGSDNIEGNISFDVNDPLTPTLQTQKLRAYSANDARYVVVGGETCNVNNPHDDCPPSGEVIAELETFHYSFLSSSWRYLVNNDWVTGGCMDEIKERLGYRFVLRQGQYTSGTVVAGNALHVEFSPENVGFAAPYNRRPVEVVLKNSQREYFALLDEDPRHWQPGSVPPIEADICTPPDMPSGEYKYYLNFPDPDTRLSLKAEFSIRLANANMLFDQRGQNGLSASIWVVPSGAPTNAQCSIRLRLRN